MIILMKDTADAKIGFIQKNLKWIIVGAIGLVLIIGIGIFIIQMTKEKSSVGSDIVENNSEEKTTSIKVPNKKMELNKYPEVNALIDQYFAALVQGDTETLSSISIPGSVDEESLIFIKEKAKYIEDYMDVEVYTKQGPYENTWVVFAAYNFKWVNLEPLTPGLLSFYVMKQPDGTLLQSTDAEILDDKDAETYIAIISQQDDVVDLVNKIDAEYTEVSETNAEVETMIESVNQNLRADVEAARKALNNQEPPETDVAAANPEEEPNTVQEAQQVKTLDTVNIRKSASEEGEKLGQAILGTVYSKLEELANGWTKIDFNGTEAYIKSEFLEDVALEEDKGNTEDENSTEVADGGQEEGNTAAPSPSSGRVRVKEAVNVRKYPSTDGEALGKAFQGEEYELIVAQADGWSRVRYHGQEAYIKSEFLE
ncbi:SH3 domain-containing protein [bacterium 1XD42-8]|jgi:uncharacterized protein YgiM (DUF1202 family)|nr:SH3 domain-containing protein [bacterium 1XD42-8]